MTHTAPLVFAAATSRAFGERIADALGLPLGALEERDFEDGEHKTRPLESVRDRDVYVVQSLFDQGESSVNDKLVRLLFLLATLKDDGAARLTAVLPYLCYARKDRRTKDRDPITTRYVATLLEAVGVDRVVTLDVHNLAAYQNAFRIPSEHLEARALFVEQAAGMAGEVAVVSPDVGGVKRAEAFRQSLQRRLGRPVTAGFMEKHRSAGRVSGETLVGAVDGRKVLLLDDLIASGSTLARAAAACRTRGAAAVTALATHGAFTSGADEALATPALDRVLITDTIAAERITRPEVLEKLMVVGTSRLFAEAIRRLNEGGSLVELVASPPL
ncbi:MAG: ribose-phosphate diphosphokinase [Pseudomonadota bacterium]